MREIKFRGWDDHYKTWIFGDLKLNEAGDKAIITPRMDGYLSPYCVDRNTVGQFTGLLDADGREIYEGDIVKFAKPAYTDAPVVITWEDGAFMVDHDLYLGGRDLSRVTIIGNVHDNPDLLEVDHD